MEKIKFEKAISRLEEIIDRLSGEIEDIEKVVTLFEEGSNLVKLCHEKLEHVENKIKILSEHSANMETEE